MDRRRWIVAAAVAAVLLLAGCDPTATGDPTRSTRPTAETSSPSKSATPRPSPTSTEVPIREQMRRDKQAVRQAYIDAFNELNRLEMAGGAMKPTKELRRTTSGEYRRVAMDVLRDDKKRGIRLTRPGEILGINLGGWTESEIRLTACEDFSDADWVNSKGEVVIEGKDVMDIQKLVARRGDDGRWRIDDGDTIEVEDFDTASCNRGGI